MRSQTTRRGFLRRAAATGGCLMTQGLGGTARPAQTAAVTPGSKEASERFPGTAVNAPVAVVTQAVSADVNPRARTWVYLTEILRCAGLFFEHLSPEALPSLLRRSQPIVLLAGDLRLTPEQRQALGDWVKSGGSLLGIGGTSGLLEIFGVGGQSPLAESWLKVTGRNHPVTAGLRSSLHVFGGSVVKTGPAATLAETDSGNQAAQGSAIVENRFGNGRAVLLAPDLIFSIVHIQQGLPVFQDGRAAPDGSAAVNEGVLKAEDGLVLDWQRDRRVLPPEGVPAFIEPVSDELREIVLRSVFYLAQQQGIPLPVLWYWPRGLKAVGLISHDTDQNDPDLASALLEVMNRCRVKSTWCALYPGGYPREFYRRSRRGLSRNTRPWEYPSGMVVKYVCRNGAIRWGFGKWVMVSTTLATRYIGLEEMAEAKWRVYFRNTLLGYLDEESLRIQDDLGRLRRAEKKSVKV